MEKQAVTKFNKIVEKFLEELGSILPDEKDIVIFQSQLGVMTMVDPSKIIKSFIQHLYPYKDKIMSKDEAFFLGDGVQIKQDYLSEAIHLTELWKNKLSEQNKQVVWKYFQVMTVLAEKFNS